MLVKSVESKVQTVRAYDVGEIYRWVPAQVSTRHLTVVLNYEALIGCVKALHGG